MGHAAAVNPEDKFVLMFENLVERLFAERMDQNEEIFVRYMNEWFRPADRPFLDGRRGVPAIALRPHFTRRRQARWCPPTAPADGGTPRRPLRRLPPFGPVRAAAGVFSDPQHVPEDHFEWVSVRSRHRLRPGMFLAEVAGKSEEPAIPEGSDCLFRAPVEGTPQRKTLLVQLRGVADSETRQRYTVSGIGATRPRPATRGATRRARSSP